MSDRSFGFVVLGVIVGIIAALLLVIGIPIYVATYYSQRASCHNFGAQTNRQVRFRTLVKAGIPLQWDCFTPTANGTWIPTKNLREFGQQP